MQAELTESKERAEALEQRCQQLEDELIRQAERAELEKLRAMDAVRSKCEERVRLGATAARIAAVAAGATEPPYQATI